MKHFDLIQLLKDGRLAGFSSDSNETDFYRVFGAPGEIEDYEKKGKYLHYDNLRIGFLDGQHSSTTLFFISTTASIEVELEDSHYVVEKGTPMTSLLALLNALKLQWEIPYNDSKFEYAVIELTNGIKIFYHLDSNQLERIVANR